MLIILDPIRDNALFAPWFRDPSTWRAGFAFLAAFSGLPMDPEALALYQRHTERKTAPLVLQLLFDTHVRSPVSRNSW